MLQTKSPWLLNLETTFLDLGGYSATMTNNRALLFFFQQTVFKSCFNNAGCFFLSIVFYMFQKNYYTKTLYQKSHISNTVSINKFIIK